MDFVDFLAHMLGLREKPYGRKLVWFFLALGGVLSVLALILSLT